jgi:hypothetical protein
MTHTRAWARAESLERLERALRALEGVLEAGRWPSGLEITYHERATIRRNADELAEELRRRRAGAS